MISSRFRTRARRDGPAAEKKSRVDKLSASQRWRRKIETPHTHNSWRSRGHLDRPTGGSSAWCCGHSVHLGQPGRLENPVKLGKTPKKRQRQISINHQDGPLCARRTGPANRKVERENEKQRARLTYRLAMEIFSPTS